MMCKKLIASAVVVLVLSSIQAGFADDPTDPNLVGWWKLDDGLGATAVDSSGKGHDGRFMSEPLWIDGFSGAGLEFDGVDDYVLCAERRWDPTGRLSQGSDAFRRFHGVLLGQAPHVRVLRLLRRQRHRYRRRRVRVLPVQLRLDRCRTVGTSVSPYERKPACFTSRRRMSTRRAPGIIWPQPMTARTSAST